MTTITATYSPDDNKLRLYASTRLDSETFARIKAAGYKWAPRQGLFVAPKWTPEREDIALELAGEIDDEDITPEQRAAERADRFDGYRDNRIADASRASAAADHYSAPFANGQPILIGHHSEKRARKDQERAHNAMRKAANAWDTAAYWVSRAAGSIRDAKRKAAPDVRARRIKTIEADLRKLENDTKKLQTVLDAWEAVTDHAKAAHVAGWVDGWNMVAPHPVAGLGYSAHDALRPDGERAESCPALTWEEVRAIRMASISASITSERRARWAAHYQNRLVYERAMLDESGYKEPPKKATKAVMPLLNYAGIVRVRNMYSRSGQDVEEYEAHPMTKAEYSAINKDYKGTRISECGTHRVRSAMLHNPMRLVMVYLTDAKAHPRPGSDDSADAAKVASRIEAAQAKIEAAASARTEAAAHNRAIVKAHYGAPDEERKETAKEVRAKASAADDSARAGVTVVVAPQLFPTPPDLAERMIEAAEIDQGMRILEPSAGTGNILRAIAEAANPADITAIEINHKLADSLSKSWNGPVICSDFLSVSPNDTGTFDRIVMNPPFSNGQDMAHIAHAMAFIAPGGRLVAICANGPRQSENLRPVIEAAGGWWIELEDGAFAESGTNVRTVMLVIDKPKT